MLQKHEIQFDNETPKLVKDFYTKLVERMEQAELKFVVEVVDVDMETLINLYGTKKQFNFWYEDQRPDDVTFKLCDFWYGTGGTDREWLNIETYCEEMCPINGVNGNDGFCVLYGDCDVIHEETTEEEIDNIIDGIIEENLRRIKWGYR